MRRNYVLTFPPSLEGLQCNTYPQGCTHSRSSLRLRALGSHVDMQTALIALLENWKPRAGGWYLLRLPLIQSTAPTGNFPGGSTPSGNNDSKTST